MRFDWRGLHDPQFEKNDNVKHRKELVHRCVVDRETREEARGVTQTNLLALCWVLGYCLVDEEVHREALAFFPPTNPALSLDQWIRESNEKYLRTGSLLLPRGVYKSTIDMCHCTQLLVCWPETVSILIMCGRSDLAFDFVAQVGGFFHKPKVATPTLFQAIWPDLCVTSKPDSWQGFTTARRQTDPPIIEPAIWGESIESGTSGYHPNILISDDLHNNRNSRTFSGRTEITKKYKLAKKVLVPNGMEIKIGTTYGAGDMFTDEILNAKPGTVRRVHCPALRRKDGERIDENEFPEEHEVDIFFPTILSYAFLRAEWEADWDTFATQYLLDVYGSNEVVFPEKDLMKAMVDESAIPLEGEYIIHWRFPCMRRGWFTAVCGVGQIFHNRCYIIDAMQGYYRPSVLAKMVVTKARQHNLHRISVEDAPGARLMQTAINNYALVTGWKVSIDWTGGTTEEESEEGSGERDLRIRNLEAVLSSGRLLFSRNLKQTKRLIAEFVQYSMIPDIGFPDVISRIADHLPQSIAAEDLENEALAWKMAQERDRYNLVYCRGPYAPPEPEPEPLPTLEDEEYNELGLDNIMPGLNG